MPHSRFQLVSFVLLLTSIASARSQEPQPPKYNAALQEPATVTSVQVVHERGVPAVEIVSTHQVVPTIQTLDSPPRLVIDLANARMGPQQKKVPVLQEDILTMRMEQFQKDPPIMRIVLDLLVPYGYTWDIAGNRLMVRLKPPEDQNAARKKPAPSSQEMALVGGASPAVVPVTSGVGEVVLAGRRFAAGSSLSAGSETAVLRLARGGEVRVCPGTTLSVTPSKSSKDLMLGLSTGALETHYAMGAAADTVLTPDFRIVFAGPGEFDFAVSTDSHGNTCVRGLKGNASSALVSELIGDRVYQVTPNEQAVFHSGHIDKVDTDVPLECGCPPPVPVLRTENAPTTVIPESHVPEKTTLAVGNAPGSGKDEGQKEVRPSPSIGIENRAPSTTQPNEVHVQIDAPLVFNAKDRTAVPAAPTAEAATLPVADSQARAVWLDTPVQAPPSPEKPQGNRVLRRMKKIFGALFH